MLDEILYLTPDAEEAQRECLEPSIEIPASDPPIMIPGIAPDGSLYPIEKIKAHLEGVHHLALSVFVFDGDELLIQQRALGKYHCGGQWANTCCTHPLMNEDPKAAAMRRLTEELGFSLPLEEKRIVEYSADVGNGLWERERVHMFRADVSKSDLEINPNPEEVRATRWITAKTLQQELMEKPEDYTPWFRIYMTRFPGFEF
ncbi:MAG: NUDIX domain-containing protein [Pseudomonadota bacterium]